MIHAKADAVSNAPILKLHGAFIRRTNFSGSNLRAANLAGADASSALFRNVDFHGANLDGTILRGADLSGAANLTEDQLAAAVLDEATRLPSYIDMAKLRRLTDAKIQRR